MSISSIGSTFQQTLVDTETPSYSKTVKKELGKEDFLTLLVTQLKNQDPLNPMESTDFSAQLAQFSSLEQLFNINDAIGNLQSTMEGQEDESLLDYIGKMVKTDDNEISMQDGKANIGGYVLDESAETVDISIFNPYGIKIRTIQEDQKIAGEYTVDWDGKDNDGNLLEDGVYTFEVNAVDKDKNRVLSNVYSKGEVTGVTYEGSIPYLIVGNRQVLPENILAVTKLIEQ